MRTVRTILFSAILLAIVAAGACGGTGAGVGEAHDVDSLVAALTSAGLAVAGPEENGVIESRLFPVPGVRLTASNEVVLAYEFSSEEEAAEARELVSADGWGIGPKYVNWTQTPHYYSNGRLIAIYDGEQSLITDTLRIAMGSQFAGGL